MTARANIQAFLLGALLAAAGCTPASHPVEVAPVLLDFGHAPVGPGAHLAITFTNPDSERRSLTLAIDGPAASDFSVVDAAPALPPHASISVEVFFRPKSAGLRTATLAYSTGDGGHGSVELSGTGARAEIAVERSFGFGGALPGERRALRIANVGADVSGTTADNLLFVARSPGGQWSPAAPMLLGNDPSQFEIEWPPANGDLAEGVAPGEPLYLGLRFLGTSPGLKRATLRLFTSDPVNPQVDVTLTAEAPGAAPCRWEIAPTSLSFRTTPGTVETRNIRIRQTLGSGCKVTGIRLSPDASRAFEVGVGPDLAIGSWAYVDVPVTFRPDAKVIARGSVLFESGESRGRVDLFGSADVDLLVEPTVIDFGDSCPPKTAQVRLTNGSLEPIRIDDFVIDGDFHLEGRVGGAIIPSASSIVLSLSYRSPDIGEDVGTLHIVGPNRTETVELHGRRPPLGTRTDVFFTPPLPQVDVLFVIDDSPSMADKQQAIASNLAAFFGMLESSSTPIDYRVAVTTTAVDAAHGGVGAGADFANGRFVPLTGSGARVITPATPDRAQQFAANAAVGAATACDGVLLRPMKLALSEPLVSGHNAGFLRADAELYVVLITDGADHDAEAVSAFTSFLLGLKGDARPKPVSMSAIMPTLAQPPAGCSYGEPNAGVATRVKDTVLGTGGTFEEICSPDWAKSLRRITSHYVPGPNFDLSDVPDLINAPDSIVVAIDGVELEPVGADGERRWTYNPTGNFIDFAAAWRPGRGTTTTVTYAVMCPASQ